MELPGLPAGQPVVVINAVCNITALLGLQHQGAALYARNDLSIQVHPDNAYAGEHENGSLGKTECWYILDCDPDATIVIGHHAGNKDEVKQMIEEKRWKDFIREIPVSKGDFFQINPG